MKESDLVNEIRQRFSLNELRDVCLDAGIPYENYSHGDKRSMTREMVAYAKRRNIMGRLYASLARVNPAFRIVGNSIEVEEPEVVEEPVTPPIVSRADEEREAIIDVLTRNPNLNSIAGALIWIMKRL